VIANFFFFDLPNPSGRAMTMASIQSLTEMIAKNISGVKGWPARKSDNLADIYEPTM
jgi:hypothetical protein